MNDTEQELTTEELVNQSDLIKIVQSDLEVEKKFIEETGLPTKIVYYCNDCEKMVKPKRVGKKLKFSCEECKGNNVSFGSEQSIASYYRIKNIEEQK